MIRSETIIQVRRRLDAGDFDEKYLATLHDDPRAGIRALGQRTLRLRRALKAEAKRLRVLSRYEKKRQVAPRAGGVD